MLQGSLGQPVPAQLLSAGHRPHFRKVLAMTRRLRVLTRSTLTLVMVLTGARLHAQGVTTAAMQGTVTQEGTETAIEAARVELKSMQTGAVFTTTTRSNGRYSFENV